MILLLRWNPIRLLHSHCWISQCHSTLFTMTLFLIPSGYWLLVDGSVLRWVKSHLSNRKQEAELGNSFSDTFSLPYGVHQGSVLGPLLFTLYTTPLSNIISNTCVIGHPGFEAGCLDVYALQIAYFAYRQDYGHREVEINA